jgi:glycosyltransferase involved in cell wall biosynthesis
VRHASPSPSATGEMTAGVGRVVIVQRRMTHYRLPLFERMRTLLAAQGVPLVVLCGDAHESELAKNDTGRLAWSTHLSTRYWLGGRLCWQPFGRHLRPGDLVVVTQENRLLYNLWLLRPWRPYRVAFWGHGRNFQARDAGRWREFFKRWLTNKVDWWFCYTDLSRDAVVAAGFPADRITVLDNAIDTASLEEQCREVSPDDLAALRQSLDLGPGPVGVFLGSLTAEKRLPFLFEACGRLRERVPHFQLLVIGDGPLRAQVSAFAAANAGWVRFVGGQQGRDKVLHALVGDVLLMPGMVGLVVLDAFVLGLPLVTTDCGIHSPEIAYLENGVNGVIAADSVADFAQVVGDLLLDNRRLAALRSAARSSAGKYSIQNMAQRFAEGIAAALLGVVETSTEPAGRGIR